MTKNMRFAALIAAAVLGSGVSLALADTVTVNATFTERPGMESVKINNTNLGSYNGDTFGADIYNFKVAAGGIVDTASGTLSPSGITASTLAAAGISAGQTFQGACIDFTHEIGNGQSNVWTVESLTNVKSAGGTSNNGNGVGISSQQALAIQDLWLSVLNPATASSNAGAELQIAIWDVLYDTYTYNSGTQTYTFLNTGTPSGSLFANNGNISAALTDAANAFEAARVELAANPNAKPDQVFALVDENSPYTQDFSVVGPLTPNTTGTPLPKSAMAGSVLLLGIAVVRRRHAVSVA